MTRIVLTKAKTKPLDEADETKYYGFVGSYGQKGFITQEHYNCGEFKVLSCEGLTNGNGFSHLNDNSLAGCIKKIIESSTKMTVFEFDTAPELFAWLAKE